MSRVGCVFFSALLCSLCVIVALNQKKPTVVIALLVRNKAHTLPHFLTLLYNLEYPKDRLSLWIRSDHNVDDTIKILETWVSEVKDEYHSVSTEFVWKEGGYPDERGPAHWSFERFENVIRLREKALEYARYLWADYLFSIDCDVFLTNSRTLEILISKELDIVAPILQSGGLYSNFWCGMSENYYYQRTDDYKLILNKEQIGCFTVPMIYSAVLIHLGNEKSNALSYDSNKIRNYDGPRDDIISFAISANKSGISLHLCNDVGYGFIMEPLEQDDTLDMDIEQLVNLKLRMLSEEEHLEVNNSLQPYTSFKENSKLGFDKIFMINLLRRPERRKRMKACFDAMGIDVTVVAAVDGRSLSSTALQQLSLLPTYTDPYHKRSVGLRFDMGKSSLFHFFIRVIRGLNLIAPEIIKWPTGAKMAEVMEGFQRLAGIRGVVGAIDGTYVPIKALQENPELYINRKCSHGITLQAICDNMRNFTDCFTGYPSSVSDIRIFRNSDIYHEFQQHPERYFEEGQYIIGDKAYPVTQWCVPPYIQTRPLENWQRHFNTLQARSRPMTMGEVGCFLSHYRIWENIVKNKYASTLILEDDIRFEPFFRIKVQNVMREVNQIRQWDLLYLGRKRLQENEEPIIEGTQFLVQAGYSYWTIAYVLSLNGAKKLLEGGPLGKLIPVDEYLPILFDKHPQTNLKAHFQRRDLFALSANPLLIYPTHYTGEHGYISDTEDSKVLKEGITNDVHDDL